MITSGRAGNVAAITVPNPPIMVQEGYLSRGETEMPTFVCKDLGMDCPFKAEAPTEKELMKKIADHAKAVHKIDPVPPDMMAKIRKAIKK